MLETLEARWPREKSFKLTVEQGKILAEKIEEFLPLLESALDFMERSGYLKSPELERLELDHLREAALYGFEIRNRYTITALLYQLGWLEEMVEEMISDIQYRRRGG